MKLASCVDESIHMKLQKHKICLAENKLEMFVLEWCLKRNFFSNMKRIYACNLPIPDYAFMSSFFYAKLAMRK